MSFPMVETCAKEVGRRRAWTEKDFGIFEWHPESHTTGAPDLDYINALMQENPDKYRHTMK